MAWPTVSEVVSAAGRELGVIGADVANPFASADKNVLQLVALLNALGQNLARRHRWTHLQKIHTFSTASGTASYALPADFSRLVDTTVWNRTTAIPVPSGVSPQDWETLKGGSTGGVFFKVLRIFGNLLYLHSTPTATETVALEYQTAYWLRPVVAAWVAATAYTVGALVTNDTGKVYVCVTAGTSEGGGGSGPTGATVAITDGTCVWNYEAASTTLAVDRPTRPVSTVATEVLWFDVRLLVAGLKLSFLTAKGFDTSAVLQDYADTLSAALGGDGAAPVLSLGGSNSSGLVSAYSLPDTGYGS